MRDDVDAATTAIALTAAMRRLRARLRQESPLGLAELTMPQALALARIVEEGPISNAALAAGEYLRPQSTHEMVLFLESRGFVERRADPADGRKRLIEVTPEGRRVVTELMGLRHRWLAGAIERDLSPAEHELLAIAAALMEEVAASEEEDAPVLLSSRAPSAAGHGGGLDRGSRPALRNVRAQHRHTR
jgi:DNA-binding MarR family transcriptional regulator